MEENAVVNSYENYREEDRFTNNARKIEFITTVKALDNLISPKAKILDCAAGTGVYSFYYAEKGHDVTALDITPRHIDYITHELADKQLNMAARVNDATDLSGYSDESFDVVLCMGPIYHLVDDSLRIQCLKECARVLKKSGLLVVAYISRYFVFQYVATSNKKYLNADLAKRLLETGTIHHNDPDCFWTDCYFSTPDDMNNYFSTVNLSVIDHLAADGISPFIADKVDSMNEKDFEIWCDYHYSICREKCLLGTSNHGLVIGRK